MGTFYLETGDSLWPNGRLWQSRYAGNYVNSSVNTAKDNVVPQYSFNANLDHFLTVYFKWSSTDAVQYSTLFLQGTALATTRGLLIGRATATGSIDVVYHNSDGNIRKTTIPNVVNSVWHKLEVRRVGTTVTAYLDGVIAGSVSLAGFTVNTPTLTTIGAQNGGVSAINGIIAKCSTVCSTGCFDYEFNQASGTTIQDTSGNGNNGTLTDALPTDFWKIGWTPVQW